MGANISTWVDTLVAALLLETPRAFTIVFTEMAVGAAISLFVLLSSTSRTRERSSASRAR